MLGSSKLYSGFDPRSVAGCTVWLDGADRNVFTFASGSNISQWRDKSGSNVNLSTTSNYPVYTPNRFGGLPGVTFSGTNFLQGAYTGGVQQTMFIVYTTDRTTTNGSPLTRLVDFNNNEFGNFSSPQIDPGAGINTDALIWLAGNSYPSHALYTTLVPQIGSRVYAVVYNGTGSQMYRNGSLQTLSGSGFSATSSTVTQLAISGLSTRASGERFVGSVGELLFYNSVLSATDRQQIEGYLVWKWGVTDSFEPTSIPGCVLWLDAADPARVTLSGSNVTAIADKSGSGNNVTSADLATSPIVSNYNGRSAVYWTATTQRLTSLSNNPTPGSAARTTFVVTHNPLATSKFFMVTGNETGANPAIAWGMGKNANADYLYPFLYSTLGLDIFSNVQLRTTPTVLATTFNGTSTLIGWINSAFQITRTTGINTTANKWDLGLRPQSGNGSIDSFFMEFIQYSSELTTTQRQRVEDYLSRKWGIAITARPVLALPTSHPFRLAPPVLRSFVPVDIDGCSLWLDAADSTTVILASGTSAVTQWNDKSGNGRNATQATAGLRPTYTGTTISFSGSTRLDMADAFNMLSAVGKFYMIFVVERRGSANTTTSFILGGDGGNAGILFGYLENVLLKFRHSAATISDTDVTVPSWQNPDPLRIWSGGYNGTIRDLFLNGNVGASGSYVTPVTNWANARIGFASIYNHYYLGTVHEIIIYNSYLPTPQRQQVEAYLANKWRLRGVTPATHLARISPGLSVQFSPISVASCALWLDGADTRTLTLSGSNVTQWNDKSGNSNNAVGTVAPTYDAATKYVLFSGSLQHFTLPNGTFPFGNTPYSIFVVAYTRNAANPQWLLAGGTQTTNQGLGLLFYTVNAVWHSWWINEYRVDNSIVNNTPAVINISYGTVRRTIVNGGTVTTNTPGAVRASPNTPNYIGRVIGPTNAENFNGGLAECIVFNSDVTTSQRRQVEGYLARKWGLVGSLPASHPYKTNPVL